MSNPIITRLGINQFWYKHWYSDTKYALNLQQDTLFTHLIQLYLDYGLTLKSNLFVHEYWYRFSKVKVSRLSTEFRSYNTFFRRFFYANSTVSIEHTFLLRNKTPEYFPMNVWLFRFTGWVIITVSWFKPWKQKRIRDPHSNSASAINMISKHTSQYYPYRRWKLILHFALSNLKQSKLYKF